MTAWLDSLGLGTYITPERLEQGLRAFLILVAGLLLARFASAAVGRIVARRGQAQETMIVRRVVYYGLATLVLASAMHQLGFKLGGLLGAAGVLTVAIGFAAQTSVSNLISGLFLIGERPFVVGNVIKVGDQTGEVLSIDLLSVKMRSFDNLYIRVPNETLIKSTITNLSHHPIRRYDLKLGVAYKEDLESVRSLLFDVAARNHLCLDQPEPLFIFLGFGDSALEFQFSVWAQRERWLEMRNQMAIDIKHALDEAGIEIPFPHRTIYTGSETETLPIRVMSDNMRNPD